MVLKVIKYLYLLSYKKLISLENVFGNQTVVEFSKLRLNIVFNL